MIELKNIQEFEQWLVAQNKIYLYGAGKMCDKLIKKIHHMGLKDSVQSILVSDISHTFKTLFGVNAVKFNANEISREIPILLAVAGLPQKEIMAFLQQQNINHFVILSDDFENKLNENLNQIEAPELKEKIYDYSKNNSGQAPKDILFLSPPYWDFHSPFSAVPCLVAELKQHGYSVAQYDIGIHCIHHLIHEKWKESAEQCLTESFYNNTFKNYENNEYSSYEEYRDDMWFFKSDGFDVALVKTRYFELNAVQKRVLEAFYSKIYLFDITDIDFDRCSNLESEINQWYSRNMLETLFTEGLKEIFINIPKVIGISITSTCQFIPGCILAELIKHCRPDVKIILGGSCADLFANSSYAPKTDIKKYFDYIIIGEGETALVNLMRHFDNMAALDTIPNLMFIDSDNEIRYTKQIVEDVTRLPAPDYDGLNLDLYLAPELTLPYQTSRGCHYGYCAFCNHDEKYRHNYRSKQMDTVVKDLLSLSGKYNNKCFQFVDEAIRPDCFKDMIEEMDKHKEFKEMKWFYYSRVSRKYDEELLRKAHANGCEMVMFGVESFNQRLLNFIKKGITADTSKYCLELFHKCGIKTYAWLLCNLPSETLEEAKEDLEEVKRMHKYIDAFSVGVFRLERNTDMYISPEKYNIISINPDDPRKFQSHKDNVPIDKNSILNFAAQEYSRYQKECHALGNRYTIFFE
ncbi:MAG: B12-binding domain-containing radical SAM protein [Lachnospiraceae bacterium]|nr:B12-binding domain-containing radical SAM protein [Lachnospiraceae bacterium]